MDSKQSETFNQKILIFLAILLLFVLAGGALFLPWLLDQSLGGGVVDQYDPYTAGRSSLFMVTSSAGVHTGWESHNTYAVPSSFLFDLIIQDEVYSAVSNIYQFNPNGTELLDQFTNNILQTVKKNIQVVDVKGNQKETASRLFIRSEYGEHLIFDLDSDPSSEAISVYTPPALIWPANLPESGFSTGQIVGAYASRSQAFTHQLTIKPLSQVPAEWKQFEPCIVSTLQLDLSAATSNLLQRQTYCTSIGLVKEERLNANGDLVETLTLVSSTSHDIAQNPISNWPKPSISALPSQKAPEISQAISNWELTRFTDLTTTGFKTAPSQPLSFIMADQPLLISARTAGRSIALNLDNGMPVWEFATENTIYGTPNLNPHNRLIYFGSSDKRLYAINEHGMFIDSILTSDNISLRPVFSPDSVWFASEDGKIYCTSADLDPKNLNMLDLVSPVVASPVVWKNLAIFGGDNGSVVAVDKECNLQWEFSTGDPIEAPLLIGNSGIVYFAGHGQIGALNASTGAEIWVDPAEAPIYFAPTLTQDTIYVVDSLQILRAYDRHNGRLLWSKADLLFSGSPLVIGEHLLVNAANEGAIYLIDIEGNVQTSWSINKVRLETDTGNSDLLYSPVLAHGKIWFIDESGTVYKLAPQREETP